MVCIVDMFLFLIGFFTGIIFMGLVSVGVFFAIKTMFSNDKQQSEREDVNAPRKRY